MESRNSRILFVAIPVLVILAGLLLYQYGYLRLQGEMLSIKDAEAVKIRTLQKYADLVAKRPGFERKLAALKETRKADEAKLIEGQTPSVAAASLQNSIKALVTAKGGTISSERVEKPEDVGKFKVISVSIDGVVPDMRFLNEALFAIETQTPSLAIRELDVRVKDFRDPRELMVRLKVSGMTAGK
jgi:hypothetical protein